MQLGSFVSPGQCLAWSLAAVVEIMRGGGQESLYRGEWSLLDGCMRLPRTLPLPEPLAQAASSGSKVRGKSSSSSPCCCPCSAWCTFSTPEGSSPRAAGRRAEVSCRGHLRKELALVAFFGQCGPAALRGIMWGG